MRLGVQRLARYFFASLVGASLLVAIAPSALSATPPDWNRRASEARLLSPAVGERAVESAVRFAFDLPKGARDPQLLVSRRAFEPSGWSEIERFPGLVLASVSGGASSLAELGLSVDAETPLWWAVSWRDPQSGALRVSEVREFTALRKFTNRVAASPVLLRSRTGHASDDEVAPRRAAALRGETPAARPPIRLIAGYELSAGAAAPAIPAELARTARLIDEGSNPVRGYLVQFADPPGEPERAAIAAAGGAIVAYVPDQAYLVRMSGATAERLSLSRADVWTTEFIPAYKVSPLVDRAAPGSGEYQVLLYPDADLSRFERDVVGLGGFDVKAQNNGINRIARLRIENPRLASLASLPGVAWIEPVPHFTIENANAQWVVQTGINNNRHVWDVGLRGQGQVVMTTDSGIRTDHDMYRDAGVPITTFGEYPTHRKIIAYLAGAIDPNIAFGDHSGASYHGTHTGGTIAGWDDPVGAASTRDGMAKEAKIWFMDLSGPALANGISPPNDLNDLFQPGYTGNAGGAARIASNSWGAPVMGAYTLNSMQVDQFMWTHPNFFIAYSNGNSGSVGSVGSPASAKNSAGIGGTGNGTSQNNIYGSTSKGPTADGRMKPTFCAPGNLVTSASGTSTNTYATLSGTSMASPAASGAIALIRQYLTEGWYPTGAAVPGNSFEPSAALLKAMAMNSGVDSMTGNLAPNFNIGWGRVTVDSVLFFAGDARRLLLVDQTTGMANGDFVEYQVQVTSGLIPLKISLAWTDYPGNPAVTRQLVNDLDLTVTNGASTFKGNVFTGRKSIQGGLRDSLNVEEGVRVPNPAPGLWTIRVNAKSIPIGPQPFALVVTGGLGTGAGAIAMDRTLYGSNSTIDLEVVDTDASSPVSVSVSSTTEGVAETVLLTGADGIFTGSVQLTNALVAADGDVSVSNGDAITASYLDATFANNLTAQATVNFDTPIITNVSATALGVAGAQVTWKTDRNSTSRVYWGATPALEFSPVDVSGYALTHSVTLPGVTPGQTYYYDVESVSLTGSGARDDLGGAHHKFTAKGQGDVVLVIGETDFVRTSTWTNSLNALGYDYDIWIGDPADAAEVGDLSSGLRSYKAVLWQAGPFTYPPISDVQRASIDSLIGGGGRLMLTGHDIGWGLVDPTSPGYNPTRAAWFQSSLHATFDADPLLWDREDGFAGDPISSPNTAGASYEPLGSGQSGDEVSALFDAGVTHAGVWKNNDTSPDTTSLRWETTGPRGSASNAYWGGQSSRLLAYYHEWTGMRPPVTSADTVRDGILDRSIQWLLGRARPTVAVVSPNGGETLTSSPVSVSWNETVAAGLTIAARTIEYSLDNGESWTTITTSAGASPYSWDVTSIPNSLNARIRIRVTDDGSPPLSGLDASSASFALQLTGADSQGPLVVAGSIQSTPNPITIGDAASLLVRVTDASTGGSLIQQAEYSVGASPAAAGSGTAMTSTFDSVTVNATASLTTGVLLNGTRTFWIRARDASGNWGTASSLNIAVIGENQVGVEDGPAVSFLSKGAPNPFAFSTNFRFGLASTGEAEIAVFDPAGRRVRTVARGTFGAGAHAAAWDGRDDAGRPVAAGLYFIRLRLNESDFEQRIIRLE